LKGLGLIPRTPLPSLSPEPEAIDDDDDDDNDDDDDDDANRSSIEDMTREELAAEVLRLRNSQTKVKVEKKVEKKAEKKVAVKRERSQSESAGPSMQAPKKQKKPKVVDLTGDSD
jgi:hypothetical protein